MTPMQSSQRGVSLSVIYQLYLYATFLCSSRIINPALPTARYLSPATSSVSAVLSQYDEARQCSEDLSPLAPPPLPAYLRDGGEGGPESPRDVCHHLLRLYCGGGDGRMEEMLTPASHTAQPLDHKLRSDARVVVRRLGWKWSVINRTQRYRL